MLNIRITEQAFRAELDTLIKEGNELVSSKEVLDKSKIYFGWIKRCCKFLVGNIEGDEFAKKINTFIPEKNVHPLINGYKRGKKVNDEILKRQNISIFKIVTLLQGIQKQGVHELTKNSIAGKNLLKSNIFIVHGHDNHYKTELIRCLEILNLNPIVLHELANEGQTIIEKFEKYSDVNFAIILLTGDDVGKLKDEKTLNFRARQNVVLEMGYFLGSLGRRNVLALHSKEVELPSDMHGILCINIDSSDSWKFMIVKELKAAGFNVDANKLFK